jgi:hypothetical protein
MALVWRMPSDQVKQIAREDGELKRRLDAWRDKEGDYYIEVVEARTGNKLGWMLVETGKGSFRVRDVVTAGDWVAVGDSQNRIHLFQLSTGELKAKLFGAHAALSAAAQLLCVENEKGKLTLYDLRQTEGIPAERARYTFANPVSFAQFSLNGRQLFVLTSNQTAYLLDTTAPQAAKE